MVLVPPISSIQLANRAVTEDRHRITLPAGISVPVIAAWNTEGNLLNLLAPGPCRTGERVHRLLHRFYAPDIRFLRYYPTSAGNEIRQLVVHDTPLSAGTTIDLP
ncbi:hypothetical protein [Salinispora tropica]|uniref:Uncharacterized protein n=1 Tax=Salinispora tropica (strain ATCC BAA-916 / DSM 44818 / JCM 13857 / NBRC 105044 / CNB-440) TaxID=369723 RepID=A4X8J8_SALTO|nr:hypothetical protein [Salinispora tropica]ABP55198.1 hypothetical protein Strop_2756 [Salinispora tropica CNB-440]